ncbi:ROK family protein [Lentzea tibetensis]|uniref:ROK family protein n=1 Tax=Lentzea tibetensis TaxID=2591470 RepID=A0A563EIN2_9PSEU|nr:ROK family protein [Lentzea tibetensis]TWP46673.1 ROK family protein [Lentzea tibetensis]
MAYLGIDIGDNGVSLRAEFHAGFVHSSSFDWPSGNSWQHDLDSLSAHVRSAQDDWPGPVGAVGVAVPASLDAAGLVAVWSNRSHWVGLDLRSALAGLFPRAEVRHLHRGALSALAESAVSGCDDLVYVGVDAGIDCGIVIDGKVKAAAPHPPIELGHMIIDRYGRACACGRRGCLQSVCSGPAVLQRAAMRRGGEVSFEDLQIGFSHQHLWAVSAVDDACVAMATALVNIAEVLNPEIIVVGGAFATGLDGFVDRLAKHTGELRRGHRALPEIAPSACTVASSLHGAVLLARSAE